MAHSKSSQSTPSPAPGPSNFAGYPVVVQKIGNVLKIMGDAGAALDPTLIRHLTKGLQYSHVEQLHGKSHRNPITGQRLFFQTREYKLFRVEAGHLTLLAGYTARVLKRLRSVGCSISWVDSSPVRARPNCYTPHWENMAAKIQFRPRQEECLNTIARVPCGIIKAVTGFGKTT